MNSLPFTVDYFLTTILPTIKNELDKGIYLVLLNDCKSIIYTTISLHKSSDIFNTNQLKSYNFTLSSIDIMMIEVINLKFK